MLRLRKENLPIFVASIAVLVLMLLLLQLWPTDTTNPAVVSTPQWDDARTEQLAQRACYDCHSHQTEWPWYTNVVPAYFLLAYDVRRGREIYNFSDWDATCCTEAQIDRMAATVTQEHMPLPYYLVLHPEALLSDVERGQLVYGLMETMQAQMDATSETEP